MSKVKVGITIPVRNCLTYTQAAVASIKTKHPYALVIVDDHSDQPMKDWLLSTPGISAYIDPTGSTGLSFNWNLGIQACLDQGCTHILVSNNDVLFHPQTIDNLVERMQQGDVVMATGVNSAGLCASPVSIYDLDLGEATESEHPDFSCFMITKKTIDEVGWFDTNFRGAYCEDCDYHARMALLGLRAVTWNRAPYYHYASMTIRENGHLSGQISQAHQENEGYFTRKWGHPHVSDVPHMRQVYWQHPFNDPTKSPKDC